MLKSRRVENGSLACLIIGLLSVVIISILSYEFLKTQTQFFSDGESLQRRRLSGDGWGALGGLIAVGYLGGSIGLMVEGFKPDENGGTDVMMGMSGVSMLAIVVVLFAAFQAGKSFGGGIGFATAGIGICTTLALTFGLGGKEWIHGDTHGSFSGDGSPFFFMLVLCGALLLSSVTMHKGLGVPVVSNALITISVGAIVTSAIFAAGADDATQTLCASIQWCSGGVLVFLALVFGAWKCMKYELTSDIMVSSLLIVGTFSVPICVVVSQHNMEVVDSAAAFFCITFIGIALALFVRRKGGVENPEVLSYGLAFSTVLLGVAVAAQCDANTIGNQCFTSTMACIVAVILLVACASRWGGNAKTVLQTLAVTTGSIIAFVAMGALGGIPWHVVGSIMSFGSCLLIPCLIFYTMRSNWLKSFVQNKDFNNSFVGVTVLAAGCTCLFAAISDHLLRDGQYDGPEHWVFVLFIPLVVMIGYLTLSKCGLFSIFKK